jgi:hypothetical protein
VLDYFGTLANMYHKRLVSGPSVPTVLVGASIISCLTPVLCLETSQMDDITAAYGMAVLCLCKGRVYNNATQ